METAGQAIVPKGSPNDSSPSSDDSPPPTALTDRNLVECVKELEKQDGGWCEMKVSALHPSISSVWPQVPFENPIHMVMGPRAVLEAWNSAALDQEDKKLYFFGGGHADYGGNEVYEFDLMAGRWTRLTDPSSLTYFWPQGGDRYCLIPDVRQVPISTHTYDGLEFNPQTG
ncbi:MAG: hypothetical protein R3310_11785, partial [Candidatus Competibacteraceae bacterium]|nr:hypothetical protein [Candidatus Competibacteraceae bacterium]